MQSNIIYISLKCQIKQEAMNEITEATYLAPEWIDWLFMLTVVLIAGLMIKNNNDNDHLGKE